VRDPIPLGRTLRITLFTPVFFLFLGCATNPVTGDRDLVLVSESQEIEMGREADRQIVETMGVVEDQDLTRFVSALGHDLAAGSERPNLPWTFRVLDDPTVNAFALPGGFVYLTRGILTHLTSKAQVAGILGHEIGHVTARHSVQQMSKAQLANLGLGISMIFVPELQQFQGLAGASLQLLFLKFSRDDERQSDELGVRYMAGLGYDPAELGEVFEMLRLKSEEEGGALPSWASTHPAPSDRQEKILLLSQDYPDAETVERAALLRRLEGVVFGRNPRHGFFDEGVFHHPDLEFRIRFTSGWQSANETTAVRSVSANQDAAVVLQLANERTPAAAAENLAGQDGVQLSDVREVQVNGLEAVAAAFRVESQDGALEGRALFPDLDGRVYAILGFSSAQAWPSYQSRIESSLETFQRETDPLVLAAKPATVELVSLTESMPVSAFVQSYESTVSPETVALINHVSLDGTIEAGLVKRVTITR